jgi:hypothetical protein
MTDTERRYMAEFCERLMKEGIDGRQERDAVSRTTCLTDLARAIERKDAIACALSSYDVLEQKGIRNAMLDFGRANALAAERYQTNWQWEQPNLAREIYYLRRAVLHESFGRIPEASRCKILNNLGNRLNVAGRIIEALEYWRRVLEIQPNFGMALSNRARFLAAYAGVLEDDSEKALFLLQAHKEATAALAPQAIYYSADDERLRSTLTRLKERIGSAMDKGGITHEDPFSSEDTFDNDEERTYRHWCLVNYLYLNPLNDLGPYAIAAEDSLRLGVHVVPVDAPHKFDSFYDQMKQEYVSARWLLYEALTAKLPHSSDKDVLLGVTEPRQSLSLATEKIKTAFRVSYSLFDKIGFFLNGYMGLGIPEKQVSFRTLWRTREKDPIRKEFEVTSNQSFCALYWLAKDFFEKANDEVAEPQARGLSEIRNYIEHKYLRVTVDECPSVPDDDLALVVSRKQLELKALHLLKLARSALVYLAFGVLFEERRREPAFAAMPIEVLPSIPHLPDAEKV